MDVKEIRKVSGLNQTEFALAIGKSKNTIINWERGDTSPTQRDIDLISKKFGHLEVQKNVPRENKYEQNGASVEEMKAEYEKRLEEKERVILANETTIFVQTERIKELKEKNAEQKEMNTELKERIKALEQSLAMLKSIVPVK